MRRPGFTIVEVLVAAALFLVASLGLLSSFSYARRHLGVYAHRAQARRYVEYLVENHYQRGYDELSEGTDTVTIPLKGGGSVDCTVTATLVRRSDPQSNDWYELTVTATWVEPLLPSRPTLSASMVTCVGDYRW